MAASFEGKGGECEVSWLQLGLPSHTHPQPPSAVHTTMGQQQVTKVQQQITKGQIQAQQTFLLNSKHPYQAQQTFNLNGNQQIQAQQTFNLNANQQNQGEHNQNITANPQNQANQHMWDLNVPTEEPNQQAQQNRLSFDLNVRLEEETSHDKQWELQPGESFCFEWSENNIAYEQVVDWYEENSNGEGDDNTECDVLGESDTIEAQIPPNEQGNGKSKCLKNHERNTIAATLLVNSNNATKLPRGMISKLATLYGVGRHTIQRIWREAMKQYKDGGDINVCMKKAGRVGRKRKTLDHDKFKDIPLRKRTTVRSLALALDMSRSTLHRMINRGEIRSHSNPMKPQLTFTHKYERLQWCVQSIIPQTIHTTPRFHLLQNVIHVDEKWFMMSKLSQKYYLLPEECEPYRACRSKRFLTKIMFLAAVSRPLFNCDGEIIWDGKIGIWPFTYQEAAKRSSKNRVAGTLETKAMQSITQEVMRDKFIHQLLPAIKEKWPRHLTTTVWIQQDNAKPHRYQDDAEFMQACNEGGLDIRLINQPAQSPDLNALDLGFFVAIQSLKDQAAPRSIQELVKAVEDAYYAYCPRLTNHIFITLQSCMVEIMKAKGGNNYKIPHMNKQGLERQGMLSNEVEVSPQLVQSTIEYLEHGYLQDEEYILSVNRRHNTQYRALTQNGGGLHQ